MRCADHHIPVVARDLCIVRVGCFGPYRVQSTGTVHSQHALCKGSPSPALRRTGNSFRFPVTAPERAESQGATRISDVLQLELVRH